IRYRCDKKEQHADDNIIPYLSPSNLPVATLCNYFLTEVINILHACVYPELISLPVNMASKRTPHGPEQHHKLIVDSTFIANPEPYDSDRRKMYYHSKSPTNYARKIQIACDFHHRIVHVSECYQGSVHDITVLRDSGLLAHVNDSVQIIVDKSVRFSI
ncbi:unnamed protein product, partial [Rotaria sp. Silwood2]